MCVFEGKRKGVEKLGRGWEGVLPVMSTVISYLRQSVKLLMVNRFIF